ncbi:sugar phosphate isomerase/epimerase family protein [Parasporobacterium paucivorans]|uniref:Sugar phosphate isomerase/epimerase n=1 Tax=Parasporobacterium paucivorans DSM 15970 TaxID=1122934 RepID=A0A1M6J0L7_9FIRM|nr:sugar phosphate isomerase/epimerase family protein [Parasporobacterium paucivorans]SHJ40217.1 Sugar phosphate isomerase/epimerase [Parasporobacterium paucivorans DSM 15970]
MNIYLSHLFEDEEIIRLAESYRFGVETIEFSIGHSLDKKESSVANYRDRMGPLIDMVPFSAHGPFIDLSPASFDVRIREVTMKRFQDAYDSINALGGKYIVFHTCFIPSVYFESSWRDNSVLFWKEFLADKDDKVKVYLENVLDNNPEPIAEVIDRVNHPAFGFCLDIGHANCFSKRPVINSWAREMGDRVKHIHIHNNNGWRDQHSILSEGTIPMKETLDILRSRFPDVGWTLEMNRYEDAVASMEWLKDNDF